MPKVVFVNEKKEIDVPVGANLRYEARKAGIEVYSGPDRVFNCMGLGACATCAILVKDGMDQLSAKSMIEKMRLPLCMSSIGNESEIRLSCQCQVMGDCKVVTRPGMNWSGENFWQKPYPNK